MTTSCLCTNPPSHTTDEHIAIKKVDPVYPPPPPPPMHANLGIEYADQPWGPKPFPYVTNSPWVRLWDSGTGDPLAHQARVLSQIAALKSRMPGVKILLTLGRKPENGGPFTHDYYTQTINYVASLADIAAVEIINEPNTLNGNNLSPDAVGAYAEIAFPILTKAGKLTVGPCAQGRSSTYYNAFMQQYHTLIGVASHHLYEGNPGSATLYTDELNFHKQMVAIAKNFGKPYWVTEWNVANWVGFSPGQITGAAATYFLKSVLRAHRDAGVAESFLYTWDNEKMPINLLSLDRSSLSVDGITYENLAAQLVAGTLG